MFVVTIPVPSQALDGIKFATNVVVPIPSTKAILSYFSIWQWSAIFLTLVFVWKILSARVLSPLAKIPGPFWETIFPYQMYKALSQGRFHEYLLCQQNKYGNIVYFANNRVLINDPNEARMILGKRNFIKSKDYYVKYLGAPNMFTNRDPKTNDIRRRQVGPAFTVSHIAEMEETIHRASSLAMKNKIEKLMDKTEQETGQRQCRINYVEDFYYLTFDVVGELAFGHNFGMLEKNDYTTLQWIHSLSFVVAIEATIPITKKLPFLMNKQIGETKKLVEFTRKIVEDRIRENKEKGKPERKDILQTFIDSVDKETGTKMTIPEIVSENIALIFAGTDTASNTMSWTLFLLMVYPAVYKKVVEEVRTAFPNPKSNIKYSEARSKLPYLEAVIYESMRYLPAVATGLARRVPKGGVELQGHKIPEGADVYVFIHGLHRNPKYWDQPDKFIPERFLGEGAAERKRNIFVFSTGYRICPGRNLAWVEIFLTMSRLLRDYDFELPKESYFGPDVIDPETGEPKIMPGFLGLTLGPKYTKRDGWIVVKPANLSRLSISTDNIGGCLGGGGGGGGGLRRNYSYPSSSSDISPSSTRKNSVEDSNSMFGQEDTEIPSSASSTASTIL
ncbi:hypothetical protein H4219_003139 [Mycoemilia scoparia]|uniref:Cytochrome P450 n=1 Tax=Mycoemilia scoparia TaxID=417184 RepID=A0A9W8A1G0_9FUNG|nr:hypothetical protein H4219_003139 [Mycoemilia scoparia]